VTEAEQIVRRLLESEFDGDVDRLTDEVDEEELNPNSKVSIEVHGCIDTGDSIRVVFPGEQPQFWSVYKRIHEFDDEGRETEALAHCAGDYDTEAEAHAEAARLFQFYSKLGRLHREDDGPA
jgi:hypothetical protein